MVVDRHLDVVFSGQPVDQIEGLLRRFGNQRFDAHEPGEIEDPAALRFIRSLEQRAGGFLAAQWDETCDVEYTFYGLGALALLAMLKAGMELLDDRRLLWRPGRASTSAEIM